LTVRVGDKSGPAVAFGGIFYLSEKPRELYWESNPMSRKDGKRSKTSAKRERTERLQVILATDELAAIDEFRYQARMPSRAAAVRELLRRGLAAAEN
jgi:hypothetical protein